MDRRPYADRSEAGRVLARSLERHRGTAATVLALPRGGVPVARSVADELDLPVDVLVVRKLGVPGHRELAMGAVASGGDPHLDRHLMSALGVDDDQAAAVVSEELAELERRERLYRADREPLDLSGRTAIVVDDGMATGSTMTAAVGVLADRGVEVVVAVPVAAEDAVRSLRGLAAEVVCPWRPRWFRAVGEAYRDFTQVSDDEVRRLLS